MRRKKKRAYKSIKAHENDDDNLIFSHHKRKPEERVEMF